MPEYSVHLGDQGRYFLYNTDDSAWLPLCASPWKVALDASVGHWVVFTDDHTQSLYAQKSWRMFSKHPLVRAWRCLQPCSSRRLLASAQ